MTLSEYLKEVDGILKRQEQQAWLEKLEKGARKGFQLFESVDEDVRLKVSSIFRDKVRTEEIKAWYSEPHGDSLFQGTSISSLTIPYKTSNPIEFKTILELEEEIADGYIELHNRHAENVDTAILEDIQSWLNEGLYYGIVIGAKVISQAFSLLVLDKDIIFNVDGLCVDPHEITSYPQNVRDSYFMECKKRINCFDGMELEKNELEASLVLADISKPKIDKYTGKVLLAPIRCNEIAALLSERVAERIREKTSGKINPRSLSITIYDTDTPYTYHEVMGYGSCSFSPILPGLTILGSSGTIDAFKWLYAYRVSLISQKIQKGSLYSEVHRKFMPFVFFGVLVPRDADILLDMNNLHRLRYRGNFSPELEFAYLIPRLYAEKERNLPDFSWDQFRSRYFN